MSSMRVRIRSLERGEPRPDSDEGGRLVELVRRAVHTGQAPTTAVVLRPQRVELIGLRPVVEARQPLWRFLAALTRTETEGSAEAVGVIGRVGLRGEGGRVPAAIVFLEWPDCRWWWWRALLSPTDGQVLTDTETIRCAVEGDPLPRGLGRWWSLGRRQRLAVRLNRLDAPPSDAVVH